jgi:hypothetical protein
MRLRRNADLLPTVCMTKGRYRQHRAIGAYSETGIASSSITRSSRPVVAPTTEITCPNRDELRGIGSVKEKEEP